MSYAFPDAEQQKPYEEGYPLPEAPASEKLPPGDGAQILPHFLTFSQIVNYASRTYRYTHDEALRDNWTNALAIRRDPVIMDALRSRQLPTAQLAWHLECEDDKDSKQAEAVESLTKIVQRTPRFQQLKMHLLEALWFGRYGVQMSYSWCFNQGQKYLKVRDFKPINGDKLVFRFSGQSGILVHQQYKGTWEQTDRGRAHFFDQYERDQLLIHRHEPEDADFYEPELGGSLQGVGIRGRIYWLWYLRSQVMAFLMDYLERCGAGGYTIYFYEAGSQTSANEVTQAIQNQWRNNAVLFPRYRDGTKGGPGIERIEPSTAGAQLMQALVTDYFDSVIRRYILGQNLTTEAASTGLGSGLADLHGETFVRYVKYDAENLADTLTEQFLCVLQKNSPYRDVPPLRFVFDVDKPNAAETLEAATAFFQMGGTVDEDQLRSIIGLEKPAPGASMLAKMGAMSPATAGSIPTGVPMMGQPGPDMGQPGMPPPDVAGGQPPMGADQPPLMMQRRGRRLRYAQPPLRLRARAWNPLPYVRAVREHFLKHGKQPADRTVVDLATEALRGDHEALAVLGDALQESSDPEWFQTISEHGLAWPPYEGDDMPQGNGVPDLIRHVVAPHTDGSTFRIQRAFPYYNREDERFYWLRGANSGQFNKPIASLAEAKALPLRRPIFPEPNGDVLNVPEPRLSEQEHQLLSTPTKSDVTLFRSMVGKASGKQKLAKRGQRLKFSNKTLRAHQGVLGHANSYLRKVGLPEHPAESPYLPVDEERSARIADLYEKLKHNPSDPRVRKAYKAFLQETLAQYKHLQEQGVKLEPWEQEGQPYANSQEMAEDARNGHLYFFTGGDFPKDHLLAQSSGIKHGERDLSYNDLFRAVHDYYGHALYGNQFGPRGEEHAYRTHARMFTPEARPAMAAETRGQNSWVNYGKHIRESSQPASVTQRPYAEQKNTTLPDELLGD